MTRPWKHRFQMYRHLQESAPQVYAEARRIATELGIDAGLKGNIGLTGAVSNCHALLTRRVSEAIEAGARRVINNAVLDERIRVLVKDFYGDEWDAACINTCEAGLWVSFDALFTPPFTGRGTTYRARYLAPYERHLHHQGGYGRPFPPRYKDLFADRGTTAGELGFYGKRMADLDVVYVPLAGGRYECHGLKYHPTPLLSQVSSSASLEALAAVAERHADSLTGFTSLGYDTPGYGYGEKDEEGTPRLQSGLAELARRYGVPYVVDNAWGLPFIGADPRRMGADVVVYSMDKAAGGPTAGLVVGREEVMVPIRRALGIHGDRWGTSTSHGKAAYVTNDPGKEAMLGVIASLEVLRDEPTSFIEALDQLHLIVREEFEKLPSGIREGWLMTRSLNSLAIELNYEGTWRDGEFGVPIFPIEDMYAGTHLLQAGMSQMGVVPTIAYDANILISPGLGTTDENGALQEDRARLAVRALMRLIEVVCTHAGVLAPEPAVGQ
ncbi:MAG: hypothetical protein DLM67_26730 [Candidatus Nephthysia bennettiae]|uniref:Aminotransferase class V-fold PLP-dependent enzyme n=2 Tax=Candidatus Nephthysia bennettiae TaxID=3127016 RepID=A0A934K5Q3_9BACT|nr:hypothetical protein [Candidatus Dormibacteraeota bacterium]PZR84943.1 MAG: hypothetical protein DLM67_26730 [Candidatus Dormibacteraeota bacterium]